MFGWLAKLLGFGSRRQRRAAASRPVRRVVRGSYDAAKTTTDNAKHWGGADGYGPVASNWVGVRRVLRNRARYERDNNCYLGGMVETKANDVIGTGPRPQIGSADPAFNSAVEARFREWSRGVTPGRPAEEAGVGLAAKLRLACETKIGDGEAFLILTNDAETSRPVKLDVRVVEGDCVDTPYGPGPVGPNTWEGVEYSASGKPTHYWVARSHPGDGFYAGQQWDRIEARHVIHWFKARRPGQVRGVPEITAALPLCNDLRRYTLAVVGAAEAVADIAAVLESEAPADEATPGEEFETLEFERGMLMNLPANHKLNQVKAEQPTTTYPGFKREIISEAGRVMHMPYNVAAGDSSTYNYASGRLDHTEYGDAIRVVQADGRTDVLDRIFAAWYAEARLVPGHLPPEPAGGFTLTWHFDGQQHVDPVKEATGQAMRLANNTTTLAHECAQQGLDWEDVLRQRAKEKALMAELGLTAEDVAAALKVAGKRRRKKRPTRKEPSYA